MVLKFLFVVGLAIGALAAPFFDQQQSAISWVKTNCKTAGQDADLIKNATDSLSTFTNRINNILLNGMTDINVGYTTTNELYFQMFKSMCDKSSSMKLYAHSFFQDIIWCFTDYSNQYAKSLTVANTFFDKMSDYFCKNNAHNAEEFVKANAVQCYQLKEDEIDRCNSEVESAETESDECPKYKEYSKCVVNVMKSCSSLLGKLTEPVMELYSCKDINGEAPNTEQ